MDATRDAPGPDHGPENRTTTIDGVIVSRFPTVGYTYGGLTELHNERWSGMFTEPIEHLYVVANDDPSKREEWYEHRQTTDRYVLLEGAARVALFDGRPDSPTSGVLELHDLVSIREGWAGLLIPAGVWHSFRITADRMFLLNAKTPGYDRENPDKFRMPMPNERVDFSWDDA
ncbi:MAG: hypothetical protein KIT89_07265 [Microcella sp.]|uniref:hypothetical protein n=1 Tax=Microcella sp. TaxID=1913979 RepID=UPI0024C70533|nr:hypothetical protein [Microcella sp.]UYN82556.1 MAG: hypothetical protein KIT89_07265 [Microcella sp.]